jgi:hypothetical protein
MSAAHASEAAPAALTQAAFARRIGVTRGRVAQLVKEGLPRDEAGRIPIEAGKAWIAANVRPRIAAVAPAGEGDARLAARTDRERSEAELARLKVEERAGKLVSREEVRAAAFERARFERDAHLGFAARLAATLAAELGVDQGRAFAVLDREMREHLQRLADTALEPTP